LKTDARARFATRLPRRFLLRLGVLVALTAAVGVAYQAVEDFIPYWDYARIESLYNQLEAGFAGGPVAGFGWLVDQVNRADYNSVFALPMMVAPEIFGRSRDSIVLSVLLIHTLLYLVAFGFLLRRVSGAASLDEIGLVPLGSALLLPSIFTATMLGFETIAVLPVLTVALTGFLAAAWPGENETLGKRLGLFFGAGVLLAATFLIRRAYAYTVISFYTAAGLVLLGEVIVGTVSWRSREFRTRIVGLAAAGLGSAATLLLVARDRVFSVLSTPYEELYAPWEMAPPKVFLQLLASVGGSLLVVAAAGYILTRRVIPEGRRAMAALLGSTAAIGFLHWILLVRLRMRLDKPMLYAPMIAVGLAIFFSQRDERRWSKIARLACLVLLLVNLGISLGAVPEITAVRSLVFANPLPPQTRDDMEQLREMVSWLRQATVPDGGPAEPILVLGATGDINDSLVKEAENHFFGFKNSRLNVPHFNSVDRTSNYPVWLHTADWVLVPRPFQFHTSLEERRLMRFGWEEFARGRGVSANFERLDQRWVIGRRAAKPVTVEVWRRSRQDTPAELLDLIDRARAFVVHHPVFPNLWVAERAPRGFSATRITRSGEHYRLVFTLAAGAKATTSAMLMEPLDGRVEIRGVAVVADGDPKGVELVAELRDLNGVRAGTEETLVSKTFGIRRGAESRFDLLLTPEAGAGLLRLELRRAMKGRPAKRPVRVSIEVEIVGQSR
jgi:hypothetical protein